MKKILLVLIVSLMLLAEGFFFIIPVKSAPAVSTTTTTASQPLVSFTGTVSSVSKPPPIGQIGTDLGTNRIRFKQNAIQFFRPTGGNITIGFPSFGGGLTTVALKNTSEVAYHFTGTVAGHAVDIFVHFKNSSNPYNRKVIIAGTISGLVGTISMIIPLSGLSAGICDSAPHNTPFGIAPACTSQCFGSMCFDWSDSASSTSYNNSTKTVTFTVGASFFFDPVALDGSAQQKCNGTISCSVSLTTTSSPDVIIVFSWCAKNVLNSPIPISSISDGAGLSWAKRIAVNTNDVPNGITERLEEWKAIASSTLSADSITVTYSAICSFGGTTPGLIAFGVSGANTASPFDPHSGIPVISNDTVGPQPEVKISTSNANDFIFGSEVNGAGVNINAGTGFTRINTAQPYHAAEYQIVSSTQTNLVIGFVNNSPFLEEIGDAIQQAPPTVTKQQTKNCTFTSLSSPTCTFASNVPIDDVSVVGVETSINTNTITSVTDSASNTYNLVTSFAVLSAVGLNAVYCSNVGTAGTLVVTVNFGATSTGVIILYDLANAVASCAGTGSDDSVGSNALSSSPSVGSYTPSQTGFEIGFLNSGCNVACTVSAGGGYTKDNDVAITAALKATSESIANSATATTTPFSLSASSAWSEISVTFVIAAETTVTLPLTCTMSNSAPQQTLTLDGASASPASFLCDASSHNITVDKSSTLTILIPIDATNTRSRFKQGSSATAALTWSVATCSSGTCAGASNTTYYQLRNLYQATPVNPTVWDAAYTINVKGTVLGTASTNCGTVVTTAGGGAASNNLWCDYNLQATMDPTFGSTWTNFGPNRFTQTTGGNTDNVNYAFTAANLTLPGIMAVGIILAFLLVWLIAKRR